MPFSLGDLGERLALAELLEELRLGQAQVVGRGGELVLEEEMVIRPGAVGATRPAGAAEAEEPGPEETGRLARLDSRLQLVRLLLGDLAVLEGLVHLVDRRCLRRVLELLRGDAEVLRHRVEERRRPASRTATRRSPLPPPATARPATVAARTFFDVSLLMRRVLSLALSHDGTRGP